MQSLWETFGNQQVLKSHENICTQQNHWNSKVVELENEFLNQRLQLTKEIFEIKESEIQRKCSCNSGCV